METKIEIDEALNRRLAEAARGLPSSIAGTPAGRSPWLTLVKRKKWTLPLEDFDKASSADAQERLSLAEGGTVRSYSLTQAAVESDWISVEKGQRDEDRIAATVRSFEAIIGHRWRRRAIIDYTRLAENKFLGNKWFRGAEDFPVEMPTDRLTDKALGGAYAYLMANGANIDGGAADIVEGKSRFLLMSGDESPRDGFLVCPESLSRRWKIENCKWVEIDPYLEEDKKLRINPEWVSAQVEDSHIFLPSVMKFVVPPPVRERDNPDWDPQSYFADVQWLNIANNDPDSIYYNPDNARGFYRALLIAATKPVYPELGVVIRHLR
jgi:hypothetical protein